MSPRRWLLGALLLVLWPGPVAATDPPHTTLGPGASYICANCHTTHHALSNPLMDAQGIPLVCQSCHVSGGPAANHATNEGDQALPNPGLPSGTSAAGTSHRWDSGAAGHVAKGNPNSSTGTVQSSGVFTGPYPKTYTITIGTAGDVGTATFTWTSNKPFPAPPDVPVATTKSYVDQFNAQNYSGSAVPPGTENWSGTPWTELGGDGGSATTGTVQVVTNSTANGTNGGGPTCVGAANYCLRIGGSTTAFTGRGASRPASISGTGTLTSATLSFSYRRTLSACPKSQTARVNVDVGDGTTWTNVAGYQLNACDSGGPVTPSPIDILSALPANRANTQIRFIGATANPSSTSDYFFADNVKVEFTYTAMVPGTPETEGVTSAITTTGGAQQLNDGVHNEGISVTFKNGASAPSFKAGDKWLVYVRPEINQPTTAALRYVGTVDNAGLLPSGKVTCATCHDPHVQTYAPFDPSAPAYGGAGTGAGRHFQRIDNTTDAMCKDCHSARNVSARVAGEYSSHPVEIPIPVGNYQSPVARTVQAVGQGALSGTNYLIRITTQVNHGFANNDNITITGTETAAKANGTWKITVVTTTTFDLQASTYVAAAGPGGTATHLPLQASKVQCSTCHRLHFASSTDGTLRRAANTTLLCTECHTLADTSSGSHFNASTGLLWPGGKYGSLFPQNTDTTQRGYCTNCHQPHGWPDAADTTKKYPTLLVDREESLCYTCHDSSGPSAIPPITDVRTSFGPTDPYRHPLDTASQAAGRKVECTDCHNVHKATGGSHTYSTTATSARNAVTGPLMGVSGVSLNYITSSTNTYDDHFAAIAYNGSNGTTSWTANPWAEIGDDNNVSAGLVRVVANSTVSGGPTCNGGTGNCLRIGGGTATFGAKGASRVANTSGATSATLTFVYRRTLNTCPNASTATVQAQASTNGSTWTTLATYNMNNCDTGQVAASFGLTPYISTTTYIRFFTANNANNAADFFFADDVQIQYGTTTATFGNFVAPALGDYTAVTAATYEYQICFKCHSGYKWLPGSPPNGLSPNGSATTPVETDLAQDFNPNNASYHPVAATLNAGTGNGTQKALQSDQLRTPWQANPGAQTMMCSDCHNTDAGSSAAQGPHGSAVAFMLRGPNTLWPPTVRFDGGTSLPTAYGTSFCNNCHSYTVNNRAHNDHDTRALYCYSCHIVIPHGGKLARLIGDGNSANMPARYAYNNDKATMYVTGFTKTTYGSYSESSCGATCDSSRHALTNGSQW